MSFRSRTTSARLAACVAPLWLLVLTSCGGDGVNAPPPPPPPPASACPSLEEVMPNFYALLNDPSQPLAGLSEAISGLATQTNDTQGNSLDSLLDIGTQGLANFGADPDESSTERCLATSPEVPLCSIEGQTAPCENRLCAMRRALDFGLKDQAASTALNDLQPLLATVLDYLSNTGPGADGSTHYQVIQVFTLTASNEGICSPANLIDVIDGLITYFRPTPACGTTCEGYTLLNSLVSLLSDPELQKFLTSFQEQQSGATGRAGFEALGQLIENAIVHTPDDSTYFNSIQTVFSDLDEFLQTNPTLYGNMQTNIDALEPILKDFLNPARPGAILVQLQGVVGCLATEDPTQEVFGALYDMLMQPTTGGTHVSILQIVQELDQVLTLDSGGVLTEAILAVFESTRASDSDMGILRQFLVQFLTVQTASELLPSLSIMFTDGVPTELITMIDNLLYGCEPQAGQ